MYLKKIFAILAFLTVVTTNFFGICSIQHLPGFGHMEHVAMFTDGDSNGECPLAPVVDFTNLQKFSEADIRSFGYVIPVGSLNLAYFRFPPSEEWNRAANQKNYPVTSGDLPLTITSPPLAYALSQGILNPKIDLADLA